MDPYAVAVAGSVAGTLALIELITRLRFRPRSRGWYWWVLRVGVDVVVAAVGVILAIEASKSNTDFAWVNSIGGWALAGVAGPAILRLRIVTIGKGDSATEIGPAMIYEPIRNFFEDELDDAGAIEQTVWLNRVVWPQIQAKGITSATIAQWLTNYVNGLNRLSEAKKAEELAAIAGVVADKSGEEAKIKSLVNQAVKLGGRRLIESLLA